MDIPDITSVNITTSYLGMKDILEETRKTVQESHLVDSDTARIVDNPGGTRSIVVVGNEINQTGREVLVINPTNMVSSIPGTTEISSAVTWPDATACAVDIGSQDIAIAFCGYRVYGSSIFLRFQSMASSGGSIPLNGSPITITAFL
jgi:hypothetical protein